MNQQNKFGHEDNSPKLMLIKEARWDSGILCMALEVLGIRTKCGTSWLIWIWVKENLVQQKGGGRPIISPHESFRVKSQDVRLKTRYSAPQQLNFK